MAKFLTEKDLKKIIDDAKKNRLLDELATQILTGEDLYPDIPEAI